jgi:hypothetical protein
MNLQRRGHRFDLQFELLTQPDGAAPKLVAVLPDDTTSGVGYDDTILER